MDELRDIEFFTDVPENELEWLCANSHEETLEPGEFFFEEGGPADRFYIVLDGELQVSRTMNGKDVILGTTPPGVIGGELSLLQRTPSHVSARAIMPSRLMVFDQDAFRRLFAACPVAGTRILTTTAERMQGTASIAKQQEKMAALGKLSAGLAHELNNPAAAARRAATSLREKFPALHSAALAMAQIELGREELAFFDAFQRELVTRASSAPALSALEQSEREEELGAWLGDRGVNEAWAVAADLAAAGVSAGDLAPLAERISAEHLDPILAWLAGTLDALALVDTVEQTSQRISELVGAIKSYTYMDRAPVQDVNLHAGLDNTLTMLRHKLRDIEVIRKYDPALPTIEGRGSELNQVWTNLIDNAIDALDGRGRLWVVTRHEADYVMVEVQDNGPGIPEDVVPRLFEPFFTTKEVGVGTGLGLDISYRIVQQHRGTIEVRSEPGCTRFIVRLPIKQPADAL